MLNIIRTNGARAMQNSRITHRDTRGKRWIKRNWVKEIGVCMVDSVHDRILLAARFTIISLTVLYFAHSLYFFHSLTSFSVVSFCVCLDIYANVASFIELRSSTNKSRLDRKLDSGIVFQWIFHLRHSLSLALCIVFLYRY